MTTQAPRNPTEKLTAQTGSIPPWVNRSMTWLLRTPFHRVVSGSIRSITFTGRKSGKVYTTPVSYTRQGTEIIAFTHSGWWKSLLTLTPNGKEQR